MAPRVLILRAPGTNCDQETAFAFQTAGGKPEVVHLNRLLENPALAKKFQILAIPGGFSYGDDISAGRIFGNQIRHHLRDCLEEFKAAGKLIIGICNGLQIIVKSGVLLPDRADEPIATLTLNESDKFEDRWVHLQVTNDKCVFLRGIERMYLPVAHADAKTTRFRGPISPPLYNHPRAQPRAPGSLSGQSQRGTTQCRGPL
jgi:phosphoribosylformylglycinamidine synthase subunit PurQ / glutaminase